jgi:hypothetical protein
VVSPPLLSLCAEFVSAASGGPTASAGGKGGAGTATGTTDSTTTANQSGGDANGEKPTGIPIAEVMACLGALWSTGKNLQGKGNAWIPEAAATAAAVLGAAGKLADQAAAVDAGTQLATRCASITPSPLDPTSAGCQSLLRAAARASEEAKGAALRENAVLLLGNILKQVWPRLSGEDKAGWVRALNDMVGREAVPSVKGVAASLAAALQYPED